MDELVRKVHKELADEVYRLGLVYQQTMSDARVEYERGVVAAQLRFESQLKSVAEKMTDALHEAVRRA